MTTDWKIYLAQPHNGMVHAAAAESVRCASKDLNVLVLRTACSSLLANGFNRVLCDALNDASEGKCTHLAMLHADLAPEQFWLDILAKEMQRLNADFMSVVAAIKDPRGLTSTGVGWPGVFWSPLRCYTMHEIMQMPETFNAEDTWYPEGQLLHNSGCWLADLRSPCFSQLDETGELLCHFEIRDRVVRGADGRLKAEVEPEDWTFSRALAELGARTYVTRKVKTRHMGQWEYVNYDSWGLWKEDNQTRPLWEPLSISETGAWLHDFSDGELYDPSLASALLDTARGSVVDMGCGRGKYVERFLEADRDAIGLDGNPGTGRFMHCHVCDLSVPLNGEFHERDWVVSLEVGEHIPQQHEHDFLDNLCKLARVGVVLSWAVPGDVGTGHVNCRHLDWVRHQMELRGFCLDVDETRRLREAAILPYFKRKVMVFVRSANG